MSEQSGLYFVGIDVSTTASKALVIDMQGNVIASQSHPHGLSTPRPLWSEQDPDDWWKATSQALRDITAKVPAERIAAIGLTGQMHGLTTLDEAGRPLRPAILWNDGRSGPQCQHLTEQIGAQKLWTIIGGRLQSSFTVTKLVWLRENEPEIYRQIRHILLPKDYARYKLSGAFVCDVADGSGISLMDIAKRTWSDELLAAWDIPRSILPELCESIDVSARVSEEAAAQTGLKAGTPIVGGAGDQPAGGVGNGIVEPGQVSLTVGTSGVAFVSARTYQPQPNGALQHFCHAIPGAWFYMGVVLSAGGSYRWFIDELAQGKSYDELDRMAAGVPRGSGGLLFAPYLTGERNPHPDPLARGAFVGLTLRHGLAHMTRSVMEGVAFGMRDNVELLRELGLKPSEAVIGGGAANSPIWRQMMTDIMGIPLYTVNTTEGAALGAAILAAVGVGAYPDVPTACKEIVRKETITDPDPTGVAEYERLYPLYRDLYPALKDNFAALSGVEG